MEKLRTGLRWVDTFTKWQGYCLAPFCLTLIFITLWDIIARQFGIFRFWAFDVEWFHWAFLMMLALGYATLRGQHVRVDLITVRFSPRTQELLMAISYAVIVIPLMIVIAIYAWDFAMLARGTSEVTLTAWVAPLWPIKFFMFLGICLMLPQCFAELIRHIYFIIKGAKL